MSEIKGCMNCGNISCGNNKKRRVDGCGRYIRPEDKIKELEAKNAELKEMVEAYDRNRDRLIEMGFPHFRNCKEYAEKLKELEAQIEKMKCCYNCANDTLEPPEVISNGVCENCMNHSKWELDN